MPLITLRQHLKASDIKAESWKDAKSALLSTLTRTWSRLKSAWHQHSSNSRKICPMKSKMYWLLKLTMWLSLKTLPMMYQAEAEITEDILAVEDAEDNLDDSDDDDDDAAMLDEGCH